MCKRLPSAIRDTANPREQRLSPKPRKVAFLVPKPEVRRYSRSKLLGWSLSPLLGCRVVWAGSSAGKRLRSCSFGESSFSSRGGRRLSSGPPPQVCKREGTEASRPCLQASVTGWGPDPWMCRFEGGPKPLEFSQAEPQFSPHTGKQTIHKTTGSLIAME